MGLPFCLMTSSVAYRVQLQYKLGTVGHALNLGWIMDLTGVKFREFSFPYNMFLCGCLH